MHLNNESRNMKQKDVRELFVLDGEEFLKEAYLIILDREADHSGLLYYAGLLSAGYSKAEVILDIAESSEAKSKRKQLKGISSLKLETRSHWFFRFFGGQQSLIRSINRMSNTNMKYMQKICDAIESDFHKQAEVNNESEVLDNNLVLLSEGDVVAAYRNLLGRDPESRETLRYQMLKTIEQLYKDLSSSDEYLNRIESITPPQLLDPLVSIIIVNYNGERHLKTLAESINSQDYTNIEVIFVDNGSSDDSIKVARLEFDKVTIISCDKNYGFSEANNIGYEKSSGDLILLLNNDTSVERNFVSIMVDQFVNHGDDKLGVVIPKILFFEPFVTIKILSSHPFSLSRNDILSGLLYYNKLIERTDLDSDLLTHEFLIPSSCKFISFGLCCDIEQFRIEELHVEGERTDNFNMNYFGGLWRFSIDLSKVNSHDVINNAGSYVTEIGDAGDIGFCEDDNGQYDKVKNVDALCGCAALIRRDVLGNYPLFVSEFFAYYEDTELSLRIRKAGYIIRYIPGAVVRHKHASTSNDKSAFFKKLIARNKILFLAIHFPEIVNSRFNDELLTWNHYISVNNEETFPDAAQREFVSYLPSLIEDVPSIIYRATGGLPYVRRNHFPRVGIYNEYFNTRGGGELRALHLAKTLSKYYHVDLISRVQFDISELALYFNLSMGNISKLVVPDFSEKDTCGYYIFVNSTHHSNMHSYAKKSYYLLSFPHKNVATGVLQTYDTIFANSNFTKKWVKRFWGIEDNVTVFYPSIKQNDNILIHNKEKLIVSVGRIFKDGHNKKQLEMIEACKRIFNKSEFSCWKLIIIGSINKNNNNDVDYLNQLYSCSDGWGVEIIVDCDRALLESYLSRSSIYWHAAGLGVDNPEYMEHFGMSIVEAMAYGCIPVAYNGGGIPEVLGDSFKSNLFYNIEDLVSITEKIICQDDITLANLSSQARENAKRFSLKNHDIFVSNNLL